MGDYRNAKKGIVMEENEILFTTQTIYTYEEYVNIVTVYAAFRIYCPTSCGWASAYVWRGWLFRGGDLYRRY